MPSAERFRRKFCGGVTGITGRSCDGACAGVGDEGRTSDVSDGVDSEVVSEEVVKGLDGGRIRIVSRGLTFSLPPGSLSDIAGAGVRPLLGFGIGMVDDGCEGGSMPFNASRKETLDESEDSAAPEPSI
jgi:hypothetical protein